MEEKILNFILECAEVQKLVPFSLIEDMECAVTC